ncbi:MAG TPA: CHAT domain-containing protein [Chloroflexi bacterium]|nr:CHAT domain-containing protein [Chloroflexota bacterium]
MVYEDFELLATDVQEVKEEGMKRILFQVRVPRSPCGEAIQGLPCEYDARQMRECLKDWERRALDWPAVIELGTWLGALLFPEPVRELLVRSLDLVRAQERGLRLRLLLEGALHNVPWEYVLLNRGGGEAATTDFLALLPNVSIVRHQAATLPAWGVEAALPARLVMALAGPSGYAALDLDEEQRLIVRALEKTPHIEATFIPEATAETLLPEGPAHLFHFAGHGDFERRMGAQPGTVEGEGMIVLEDGYGDPAPLSAGQLALRLRQAGVRVAVLGACRSGRRDDVNVWSSVAAALLKAELGAVVGMQHTIRDDSAIAFSGAFYRTLVAGLPIDEAVTNGRIAVAQLDAQDWGVPVLYLRARDGVVFPEYTADPDLEAAREELVVRAKQRIKELHGKAVTIKIGKMTQGRVEGKQEIEVVAEGGEATVLEIDELGGGSATAKQKVDKVDKGGSVTGVKVDLLG